MSRNKIFVTPAKAGVQSHQDHGFMKLWMPAFAGMTMVFLLMAAPVARAAAPDATAPAAAPATAPVTTTAKAPPPYNYAPDDCEFRMVLPGEPEQVKRCAPDDPNKCNMSTSFTHVFDMSASVNITVTCLTADPGMYAKYSGPVMQQTLATVSKNKLDKYETGYQQYDVAKQATVLGTGKAGASDMVYIAQLWIGHHSMFTVEGSMIGDQRDDADKMFTDILKSIRHKDWKLGPNGQPVIPPGSVVRAAPPPAAPQQEPSSGPPMPSPAPEQTTPPPAAAPQ